MTDAPKPPKPDFRPLLGRVAAGETLSVADAAKAFDIMMSGEATPSQMGGFLMALRVRGETVEEITGGAMTMRAKALMLDAPAGSIDTCGTGGDASGTLNVSTAAALIAAACGVPVAKHGNRALSSKSGSADVLAALGVNIDADMTLVRKSLWEAKIGFLMAPRHHGAMRNVGATRVELGTRTIFNLLGPLSNPAGARRQLIGVFAKQWLEPMATVLGRLGSERVWVVHGSDGLDEITTTGPTHVAELDGGKVKTFTLLPEELGVARADGAALKGGDAEYNAARLTLLLNGEKGPYRDIAVLNAGAALLIAGKANDVKAGMVLAAAALDDGRAKAVLTRMVSISHETPPVAVEAE